MGVKPIRVLLSLLCGILATELPHPEPENRTGEGRVNMKAEEKRQRFHGALLQMLYPPPPKEEDHQKSQYALTEGSYSDQFPDELKWGRESSSSSSSAGEGQGDGPKKLTRAQRKRLRKKKLMEAASRRRKVIGPTLPSRKDDGVAETNDDVAEKGPPPGVRPNADNFPDVGTKNPGERLPQSQGYGLQLMLKSEAAGSCSKRNNQKHRRIAKKLASERLKSSSTEDQGCCGFSENGDCKQSIIPTIMR